MITINITKAKAVGHEMRRAARAEEFKPFDEAIAKQIPGQVDGAEAARQAIRDKYAALQAQMDAATTADELKNLLPQV
jgi:predicted  nucleic acid-binding Zn-ribbon protein